jgi:hypothetical protein
MRKMLLVAALSFAAVALSPAYAKHPHPGKPVVAPEIDPASALSGLMLLAGSLAVIRGRRTKK